MAAKEILVIDLESNFWTLNPFFKVPFKDLYSQDKSKNKEDSSKFMWVITMLYHQLSPIKELSHEQKIKELESWFVKDKINLDPYVEEIERFINITVQWEHWYIAQWRKKLEERDHFINMTPYNAESYELLEKLLGNSKKIWDQYLAAEREMQKAENEGSVMGDIQESATELGLI